MCEPTDPCGACDYCERERMRDLADDVAEYAEQQNPDLHRFVTLTLPGDGLDAGDSFDQQVGDFRAMVHELMDRVQDRKGPTEWVGGIEKQENGNPHAHLLVDQWIDQDWLASAWADCGDGDDAGGFVRIQDASDDRRGVGGGGGGGGAAAYVCAYVDGGVIGNIP